MYASWYNWTNAYTQDTTTAIEVTDKSIASKAGEGVPPVCTR